MLSSIVNYPYTKVCDVSDDVTVTRVTQYWCYGHTYFHRINTDNSRIVVPRGHFRVQTKHRRDSVFSPIHRPEFKHTFIGAGKSSVIWEFPLSGSYPRKSLSLSLCFFFFFLFFATKFWVLEYRTRNRDYGHGRQLRIRILKPCYICVSVYL